MKVVGETKESTTYREHPMRAAHNITVDLFHTSWMEAMKARCGRSARAINKGLSYHGRVAVGVYSLMSARIVHHAKPRGYCALPK